MTQLTIKSISGKNEAVNITIDYDKVYEKKLLEIYRIILRNFPVKTSSKNNYVIFEIPSGFALKNMPFKEFNFFIRQYEPQSDKFLFIFEEKYFVKNILGKAVRVKK